jgi:hypothetical protein
LAYGADGVTPLTDVEILVVGSLPSGLNLRTTKDSATLYGDLSSLTDLRGGIKSVGLSQNVQLRAFKPGTFYDHPDRAALLTLTYNVSDATPGSIETAISGYVDSVSSPFIRLHARPEIKLGKGTVTTYAWTASGTATGSFLDSANAATTTWSPTSTGQVIFNLVVGATGASAPSFAADSLTLDIATGTNWTSTGKLKIVPADTTKLETQGYSSEVTIFGTKLTDLQTGQTATLTPTVVAVGTAPVASAPVISILGTPDNTYTDTNSTNGDIAEVAFTIPAGAIIGDKYVITIAADTGAGRVGTLVYYVLCTGNQKIVITPSTSTISINNGVTYTSLAPIVTMTSSQSGVSFALVNAPAGLYIDANGNILGKAYKGGTGVMRVYYGKSSFLYEDYITISYTVTEVVGLISPTLSTPTPTIAAGTNLKIDWGFTGTATNFYIKRDNDTEITLAGNITTYTFNAVTTNTVIGLRAVSAVGESFAAPLEVLVGATTVTRIPQSPTIAYLYQDNILELNWSPTQIGADTTYSLYSNWAIWTRYNSGGIENLVATLTGKESGGTDTARNATLSLVTNPPGALDTVYVDMQAISSSPTSVLSSFRWNKSDGNAPFGMLSFPRFGTVVLDKNTASKAEPIKVTIAGFTGDKWRVVFADGSTTSFLPMSATSTVISFVTGGTNENIRIEVESDYSSSLPSVRLRSVVKKSVFVIDQDYVVPSSTDPLGNVGFGGDAGFEITDANSGLVTLQPYISIVRSLVKDEVTNELKLMVATSRTQDSSSSMGTMAIDVFPILGRPHIKDLIKPLPSITYDAQILNPVKISTDLIQDIIIGQFVEIKMVASGGTGPFSWYADSLPTGLSISTDGTIYGSVFQLGTFTITVSIADSSDPAFIDEKIFNLVVKSDLAVQTSSVPAAATNSMYSQVLLPSGGVGPFQWSLVGGELPLGLTVNVETGEIRGRATTYNSVSDFLKTYTFVVQVVDSVGAKASRQLTMVLNPSVLTVSDLDQPVIYRGEKFRLTSNIYGGKAPYTNLTVTDGTGVLTTVNSHIHDGVIEFDVPETVTTGNYTFSVSVTDDLGTVLSKTLLYSVRPYIGEFRVVGSYIDNTYNTTESADHFIPVTTVAGAVTTLTAPAAPLSNGLTVTYNDTTKQINVKGPITVGGNLEFPVAFSITGTAFDGALTKVFTMNGSTGLGTKASPTTQTITPKPYKVGSLVTLDANRPYYNSSTNSGNSLLYTRVQPGQTLPAGLSLDMKTGLVYGIVENNLVTSTILERVVITTNDVVGVITINFNIKDDKSLILDTSNLGVAKRGLPYTGSIVAQAPATGPLTLTIIKGQLPAGISTSITGTTINFSGTPTVGGYTDIWMEVQDLLGDKELLYKRFEVSYSNAVSLQTSSIPLIIQNTAYSFQLSAIGGTTPYTYATTSGTLPAGITISSTGLISGTTTVVDYNSDITFQVTDSSLSTDSKIFNVRTDPGYTITTVTGTSSVGNWPQDQQDLSTIQRVNLPIVPTLPGVPIPVNQLLLAFTVRIVGLDSVNTNVSVDDPNLTATLVTTQIENGGLVGYARITNPAKTAPTTLGISGTRNFNLTVSNPLTGRSKTQTLTYVVLPVSGTTGMLEVTTNDGYNVVTPRTGQNELAFMETYPVNVNIQTNNVSTYTTFIAGLDLTTYPMDVVSLGLISVVDSTPGLSGRFSFEYFGVTGGQAQIKMNYLGSEFGTPTPGQYLKLRVNDVAFLDTTSGPNYVMDVFTGTLSVVAPREITLNVLQLVKVSPISTTTSIFLNEPYTFQVNFDAPLNIAQNPTFTWSGLQGVSSESFILNASGQKIGYKIQGLWPKNNAETYPKLYNIGIMMGETLKFTNGFGNAAPVAMVHFNSLISTTVLENNNALNVTLNPWDTSSQLVGNFNIYASGASYNYDPGIIPTPPTVIVGNGISSGNYKLKLYGTDTTNPICGYSLLNLPNNLQFYINGSYFTEQQMATAIPTGGLAATASPSLGSLASLWSTPVPGFSNGLNMYTFPTPSVPVATDYSTIDNIITNAIPIQKYTIPVKMEVQELTSDKLATGYGNLILEPSCSYDHWRSSYMVVRHIASGVATTPDTFEVLGYYYDANNPTDYVSATFPVDGRTYFSLSETTKIYIIGQIPYLATPTERFSRVTWTGGGAACTVTHDTITNDPVFTKINNYGLYLKDPHTGVLYTEGRFYTNNYNSYTVTLGDLNQYILTYDLFTGSATDPTFATWHTGGVGRKQGRMKFKPLHSVISTVGGGGGGGGCVPGSALITMSDKSKKKASEIVVGDIVLSYNSLSKQNEDKKVTDVIHKGLQKIYELVCSTQISKVSEHHRVFEVETETFFEARSMVQGNILKTEDSSMVLLDSVDTGKYEDVMTFTVEDNHNYYADSILAHNKIVLDCVPSGSRVTMGDGSYKNIEELEIGDQVMSLNQKTKKFEVDTVDSKFKTVTPNLINVVTEDGDHLSMTPNHSLYTGSGWVFASNLVVGSDIYKAKDGTEKVVKVTSLKTAEAKDPWVYLCEIKKNHTLVVDDFVCHNIKYKDYTL